MIPKRILATLLFLPSLCWAQPDWREVEWGSFTLRAGGSYIHPDDNSSSLKFRVLQHWSLYNTTWEMESSRTWNISGVWKPMEYWGIELMYMGGADYDVNLDYVTGRPGYEQIHLGDFESTTGLAFVNWYILGEECLGQPYIGAGINYTDFREVDLDRQFDSFLRSSGVSAGPSQFNMGHSWDWAAQVGVDFLFNPEFPLRLNVAAIFFQSETDATITFPTDPGHGRLYADFKYNPWIFNLSLGYRF